MEITVDPGRDTPARLAAYSKEFGADWVMPTGTPANLDALWKFFGVSVQIVPEEQPPKLDWWTGKPLTYDVDHTDGYFLIDATGHERFSDSNPPNLHGHLDKKLTGLLNAGGLKNLDAPERAELDVAEALALHQLAGRSTIPSERRPDGSSDGVAWHPERMTPYSMVRERPTWMDRDGERADMVDDDRRSEPVPPAVLAPDPDPAGPADRPGTVLAPRCRPAVPALHVPPQLRRDLPPEQRPRTSRPSSRGSSRTSATSSSRTSRSGTPSSRSSSWRSASACSSARPCATPLRCPSPGPSASGCFGEGLGMVLTGSATALTGAPGSVFMYGLIGLMAWPTVRDRRRGRRDGAGVGVAPRPPVRASAERSRR